MSIKTVPFGIPAEINHTSDVDSPSLRTANVEIVIACSPSDSGAINGLKIESPEASAIRPQASFEALLVRFGQVSKVDRYEFHIYP